MHPECAHAPVPLTLYADIHHSCARACDVDVPQVAGEGVAAVKKVLMRLHGGSHEWAAVPDLLLAVPKVRLRTEETLWRYMTR
jgi:hypothetical protein